MCIYKSLCFGCMSLKTGSNLIALLGIFSGLIFLYSTIFGDPLHIISIIFQIDGLAYFLQQYQMACLFALKILLGILLLVNVLLVFGGSKRKTVLLLPWLIINITNLMVG
jgi:hypothetical protein